MVFDMNLQGIKPLVLCISEHKYRIINTESVGLVHNFITNRQCPTGRVFQYLVRSGIGKIRGSGSGSGRVGLGIFWVSFLLSGISGYSWVFLGN